MNHANKLTNILNYRTTILAGENIKWYDKERKPWDIAISTPWEIDTLIIQLIVFNIVKQYSEQIIVAKNYINEYKDKINH